MENPYQSRLAAIHEMLGDSSQEIIREGYDLLFNLWLENLDDSDFKQDFLIFTVNDVNIIQEFENRINKLVIREKITDIYLKVRLRKLASDIENLKVDVSKENQEDTESLIEEENMETINPVKMKIFISYYHQDEVFKNELVIMLAGLQRQGIIDTWQDRCIAPGSEWFKDINRAMDECRIALLLISSDFIASGFIQTKELTRLFERRLEKGMHVIPIIVRPCLWQSEPIIKDLQALPKDGKPVISFSKDTGARDEVWMTIGMAIEKTAKEL